MVTYYNRLPHFVNLKNKKYAINTDYRIFINFENDMTTGEKNKLESINDALYDFYMGKIDEIARRGLFAEAIDKFIWFYHCGLEDYQEGRQMEGTKKTTQVFNYNYDAQLICGAYALCGYDLHKYLHWWKFKEIWNSLPQDCEFSRVKSYRAYDGDDKDQLKLKEYYKLPPTQAEIKDAIRRKEIYEQLK